MTRQLRGVEEEKVFPSPAQQGALQAKIRIPRCLESFLICFPKLPRAALPCFVRAEARRSLRDGAGLRALG